MYYLDQIKQCVYTKISNRRICKQAHFYDAIRNDFIQSNCIPTLPKSCEKEIRDFWSRYVNYDIGLNFQRIASLRIPQDSLKYIVSESVLYPLIMKRLNPEMRALGLEDKGLYNTFFSDVKRPNEIIRNVKGSFLDSTNNLLDRSSALTLILNHNKSVIFKKSIGSYGGKGVRIIDPVNEKDIIESFDSFHSDFVVQEILIQSEQTSRFNPSSLNTFRVVTLLLNGKFSCLAAWLRCGAKKAKIDNLTSGGMAACVSLNGQMSCAINYSVPKIDTAPSGLHFEDCTIASFNRIIDLAEGLHKRIPSMSIVGWDFALDINDDPVFIEANLLRPDTYPWQMTQGPIFGDRLFEVLAYCFPK